MQSLDSQIVDLMIVVVAGYFDTGFSDGPAAIWHRQKRPFHSINHVSLFGHVNNRSCAYSLRMKSLIDHYCCCYQRYYWFGPSVVVCLVVAAVGMPLALILRFDFDHFADLL